jgi:hypothetical protein
MPRSQARGAPAIEAHGCVSIHAGRYDETPRDGGASAIAPSTNAIA